MNHAHAHRLPARLFPALFFALAALPAGAASAPASVPASAAATASAASVAPAAPAAANTSALETQCDPLLAAGKFADAQAIAQNAIAADPKNAEAHYYLGLVFIEQNNYADATPPIEKAIALAPDVSKYHRALGDACGLAALHGSGMFHKLGMARKSKAAYEKAVALDPTSTHARESLINYLWEAPAIAGGGKEKAYAQIDELEKINPSAGRAQRITYYIKDENYAAARAQLAAELAANPNNYRALYQTGQLAALAGDAPAARAAYQAALALAPDFNEAKAALEKLK